MWVNECERFSVAKSVSVFMFHVIAYISCALFTQFYSIIWWIFYILSFSSGYSATAASAAVAAVQYFFFVRSFHWCSLNHTEFHTYITTLYRFLMICSYLSIASNSFRFSLDSFLFFLFCFVVVVGLFSSAKCNTTISININGG